jgi:predicted glycogen debranching enzyme
MSDTLAWGRQICGDLGAAESREWLCANGIGGFASGTVAGTPTRRYHGLLVAALQPPLGRTLLAAHVHETAAYDGQRQPLATSRWAGGTVAPDGYRHIESFRLEGTTPVWTYACGDALVEKRIWMEPGANTTYVRYVVLRARRPVGLALRVLVNYRDYHATTRAGNWRMDVTAVPHGVRVTAFGGARPFVVLVPGAEAHPVHDWFRDFDLAREAERGLDHLDDALHVVTFEAELARGASLTLVASTEAAPALAGEPAWQRRVQHEARVLQRWTAAPPEGAATPGWIAQLVLAADQFIVRRATPEDPDGLTVMAGYHWFGDWGRDTMIALPGLADHLGEHGVGSVAEIFDDDPPFRPAGCVAQAWSVAETLRAWHHLARGRGGMLQK